jgi:O-antigen ligase
MFWRKFGLSRTLLLVVLFIPLIFTLPSRLDTIDASEESALGRIEAWYEGINMLLSNPVFGVGFENFTEHNSLTAHNSFVLVFAETGLIGYYFWLSFIGTTFGMLVKILCSSRKNIISDSVENSLDLWKEYQQVAWTLFLSITGYIISAFFLSRSYNIYLYILFGLVAGFHIAVRNEFSAISKVHFSDQALYYILITISSVIAIYLLTKILLMLTY